MFPTNIQIKIVRIPHQALEYKSKGWPPSHPIAANFSFPLIFNVGLKHFSDAKYIISTCADVYFSSDIFLFLQKTININKDDLILCTRVDIPTEAHENITYNDIDSYITKINRIQNEIISKDNLNQLHIWPVINGWNGAIGDFQMLSKENWNKLKGHIEYAPHRCFTDINLCQRAMVQEKLSITNIFDFYQRKFVFHLGHKKFIGNEVTNDMTFYPEKVNLDTWGDYEGQIEYIENFFNRTVVIRDLNFMVNLY